MRDRLTKAQVEELGAALDGPVEALMEAVAPAVAQVHGTDDVAEVLRSLDREDEAGLLRRGDRDVLWALATELIELRRLTPG